MDIRELYERGLKLRKKMFGADTVDKRMQSLGEFGVPLQQMINAYAYGDVWSRDGLTPRQRSLVVLGINAATGHPNEFRVHVKGALANGCTLEEIQGVLLLGAGDSGIPAALEAHHIALEVFNAQPADR